VVYSRIWDSLTPELRRLSSDIGLPVPEIRDSVSPEFALAGTTVITSLSFTVIATIRAHTGMVLPHSAIHVYRVDLRPLRCAPVAVYEEICRRAPLGFALERLLREYWQPTGVWHLREALARELIVLEEAPAASDAECSKVVHRTSIGSV
jgi:hypothetical protein